MSIVQNIAFADMLFRTANFFSIIDCTFYGIFLHGYQNGVIIVSSNRQQELQPIGNLNISSTSIANCGIMESPNYLSGMICSDPSLNFEKSIIWKCTSAVNTFLCTYSLCNSNYSSFSLVYGRYLNSGIRSNAKVFYCNHSKIYQSDFTVDIPTLFSYSVFNSIRCEVNFVDIRDMDCNVSDSLFSAMFTTTFTAYLVKNCYFVNFSLSAFKPIECVDCVFDVSCIGSFPYEKTNITNIPTFNIPPFESFNFRQKEYINNSFEVSEPLQITNIHNRISIDLGVFIDINIDDTPDTIITITSPLFRMMEIQHSYFQNCSAEAQSGAIFIPMITNPCFVAVSQTFVQNVISSHAAFYLATRNVDDPISPFTFKYSSFALTQSEIDGINLASHIFNNPGDIHSDNSNYSTKFKISYGLFSLSSIYFNFNNYYDTINMTCLFIASHINATNCNFINFRSDMLYYPGFAYTYNFVNLSFINSIVSNLPSSELICVQTEDNQCEIYNNKLVVDWAFPSEKKKHINYVVLGIVLGGGLLFMVTIASLIYALYHCRVHKEFLNRRLVEQSIIDDFG